MSKGARKTGGRRRRSLREMEAFERATRDRPEMTTVLIVGEGEKTERNYFQGLTGEEAVRARFTVTVKKGHGRSAEDVVKEAIDYKKGAKHRGQEYDEVWCVLDVEGPNKRDSLDRAVALAEGNHIRLCLSNPCFEIWLLSHFVRRTRAYNDCAAVIVDLSKYWRDRCGNDYRKNDERIYQRVSDLTSTAIKNAQWVRETHRANNKKSVAEANSSTNVYLLVKQLTGIV